MTPNIGSCQPCLCISPQRCVGCCWNVLWVYSSSGRVSLVLVVGFLINCGTLRDWSWRDVMHAIYITGEDNIHNK